MKQSEYINLSEFVQGVCGLSVKVKIWNIIGLLLFITPLFLSFGIFVYSQILCISLFFLLVGLIDINIISGFFGLSSLIIWILIMVFTIIYYSSILKEKKVRRNKIKLGMIVPDDWTKEKL